MTRKALLAKLAPITLALASVAMAPTINAQLLVQCPGDDGSNGGVQDDAIVDDTSGNPTVNCLHLTASDGYINMGDGRSQYFFSFKDVTGTPFEKITTGADGGQLQSDLPAPTAQGKTNAGGIRALKEGDQFYLTLSNVGMALRPDLPDAHTVHFHGFPEASTIYDGVPDVSLAPNSFASMTYFYNLVEPGSYIYHCHFEATEHMQMGMIGNLWVQPKQNWLTTVGTVLSATHTHAAGDMYVYNDGDGSTHYDVEYPMQIVGFDGNFHDASEFITALPFASMEDEYPMLNGRGYPDTVKTGDLLNQNGYNAQKMNALVEATVGQRILLRMSNVSIINAFTLTAPGLTLELVGRGARVFRAANGTNLHQKSSQVTIAGGDVYDVIIDTAGVTPGTYFLYTSNMDFLRNNQEDNGGIMTEIRIN